MIMCVAREGGRAHTCARADLAPICTCGCDPRDEYYVIKCVLSNGKRIIVFGQQLVSEERTDHEGARWAWGVPHRAGVAGQHFDSNAVHY